jgi:hypothetical protein
MPLDPVLIRNVSEDALGEVVEGLALDGYSHIEAERTGGTTFDVRAS